MAKIDYAGLKKGGFMRQKQKGKFSLRLQVVAGNVTAENLRAIQEVADTYGEGYVHLTSRQSIEIPFIDYEDIEEVKAKLAKGGVKPGVCGPRVRTVTGCQGDQVCPSGNIDSYDIAKKLDARYYARELPHKFKFGVTGCQNNCLKAEENDVGIKGALDVSWKQDKCTLCGVCVKACREGVISIEDEKLTCDFSKCNQCGRCVKACPFDAWEGQRAYHLSFGGLFGNKIAQGESLVPLVKDEETLFRVTDAAITFFAENANPGERFKFTADRVGWDQLKIKVQEAYYGK
ncbi:MAG: 4Fe-4S binding protein [Eubacterium sp.]|nr:4Fe-4S binding protein [Eubacterium sp.]